MNKIYTNNAVIEKPGDLIKALDEPTLANYERLKAYLRVYGYKLSDLSRKLIEVKKYASLNRDYTVNSVYNLRVAIVNDRVGNDYIYQWHDILEVAEIMTMKQPTETKWASKHIVKVKIRRSKNERNNDQSNNTKRIHGRRSRRTVRRERLVRES